MLAWRAPAVGVQIDRCQAGNAGPAWSFVGPEAVLLDGEGRVIGTHFGGPSWVARDGTGVLANAASIQRLHTAGAVQPPAGECTAARVGCEARGDHRAYYYLYRGANWAAGAAGEDVSMRYGRF